MNLQTLRNLIRLQLDLPEEDDLSTVLLDSYIEEGVEQTLNLEARWPFHEATWILGVTAGTPTVSAPDIRHIVSVRNGVGDALARIGHQFAEANFTGEEGDPTLYSTWGGEIHLWPKPEEDDTLTIRGYRAPASMNGVASAEPDMDERLHRCVLHYAISRAYAQQEDEVLARENLQTWSALADSARRAIMRSDYQGLWTLGGGSRRTTRRPAVRFV